MRSRRSSRWLMILLSCLTLLSYAPLGHIAAPPTAHAADPTAPTFLRDLPDLNGRIEDASVWTVGGGYLYWAKCNLVDSGSGYLRRWPLRGGRVVTMQSGSFCNTGSWAGDETGLYYWNGANIVRRVPAITMPFAEQIIAQSGQPSGPIILNNRTSIWRDYIFWVANNTLYSAHRYNFNRLAEPTPLGANAHNVVFADNGYFYWFADGLLYRALTACLGFGGSACAKEVVASEEGNSLTNATKTDSFGSSSVFPLWTRGAAIRGIACRLNTIGLVCSPSDSYVAAGENSVGSPATDGQFLFWVENSRTCSGILCFWSARGNLMKWNLRQQSIINPNPFDTPAAIACGVDCGGNYQINHLGSVVVADGWVYFDTSNGISRIRTDAPPFPSDLAFTAWEITQGIQNLRNDTDLVPLVSGKATYVRVYGSKLNGPNAYSVGATLIGVRANGSPLPGSPLSPLNGGQDLLGNFEPNRGELKGSWLFQLPTAWTTAGDIRLHPLIDPNHVWSDLDRSNNTIAERTLSFGRLAPVCLVFIPVRTNAPVTMFGPSHEFAIDMARRLLPTDQVWTYRQNNDIAELEIKWGGPFKAIPYPSFGPYELDEDSGKILLSLFERDQLSDDPDECDDAGARTHYVGVVAAETKGDNGSSWRDHDNLWFRLPPADFSADWKTQRAVTLAHELGHNYGRKHINCGNPEADQGFDGYDYPPCQLDIDDGASRYYGFTLNAQTGSFDIIPPTTAGDLMSYAHKLSPAKPRWISDVTWRRLYQDIPDQLKTSASAPDVAVPNLDAASSVVLISGLINLANPAQSVLNNAWVYPTGSVSQAMLRKWQRAAAPTQAARLASAPAVAPYHLRLYNAAGNVLDDRAIIPDSDGDAAQPGVLRFALNFPAPTEQVARLELLDGDTVIASRLAGTHPPTVTILSPAGDENIDDRLTISWRGTDPDQTDLLLFNLQYSPDSGQTWRALLTSFPNRSGTDTVTINMRDLSGLPASTSGGLLRVTASDGFNTTLAVSQPFTVANRAPQPYIEAPGSGPIAAGQPVLLQGGASDPEEGGLSGTALHWSLDGQEIGEGAQQQIAGLAPGSYRLALTARDAADNEATTSVTLTVAPLVVPLAGALTLDGTCDDDGYATAAQVPLPTYGDGTQAFVRLVRTDDALWACFIGMRRTGTLSPRTLASLRVDTNSSRDSQPQPDDRVFVLGEDGVAESYTGNGDGYVSSGSAGFGGQVSASDTTWMAEMRIDASALDGWGHVVGLSLEQVDVGALGDNYHWPRDAIWNNPSTWATAVLGEAAQLSSLVPDSASVGSDDLIITLAGSSFAPGATVLWNGAPCPTSVISSNQLQAIISAADLAAAGIARVAVANPGLQAAPSNALAFTVANPAPHITQLALADKTLVVTGSSFVSGATVIWNGEERRTTFVSDMQLQAVLSDLDLVDAAATTVTIFNPGPGGGISNSMSLTGDPGSTRIYLPLVMRN